MPTDINYEVIDRVGVLTLNRPEVHNALRHETYAELTELADQILDAGVDVSVWIGPSGSRAYGGAAELAGVADEIGMAPGTRLGDVGDNREGPATGLPDFISHLFEAIEPACADGHRGTVACKAKRGGAADAGGRAGDGDDGWHDELL